METTKSINATSYAKGEFAIQVIKEALSKPTESAIKKNEEASALLRKLRGY